jgi:hypothetical protein
MDTNEHEKSWRGIAATKRAELKRALFWGKVRVLTTSPITRSSAVMSFIQRYAGRIIGQMSGWDRLRFRGTLRMLAHAAGLSRFLGYKGVLLKDFGRYAQEVSERTREASLEVARAAGREVVYVRDSQASKEDLAREIQRRDGIQEGLICVLTAVESRGRQIIAAIQEARAANTVKLAHAA